jgi:hypothetical protein
MTEAWVVSPKLKSDTQKRAFLSDYVHKSKTIGIECTVDVMIPCLINAFNSDQAVHPDLYEVHVGLLFANLGELIKFLGKNSQRTKRKESIRRDRKLRRRSLDDSSQVMTDKLMVIDHPGSSVPKNKENDLMDAESV